MRVYAIPALLLGAAVSNSESVSSTLETLQRAYDGFPDLLTRPDSSESIRPSEQQAPGGISIGSALLGAGVAVLGTVAACYCAYEAYERRLRHIRSTSTPLSDAGVLHLIVGAATYDPPTRDCLPGESHDVIIEEVEEVGDAVLPVEGETDPDAPPGITRRCPASRRISKRKKYVHETLVRGTVNGAYLSHIVAEARNVYGDRRATESSLALARGYMVREMQKHGMRASHIDAHIDLMVVAVFTVTDEEIKGQEALRKIRESGRLRGGPLD